MRERAGLVGATLEISEAPEGGCEVRLELPTT
jgi:signal transduction histidine kinase